MRNASILRDRFVLSLLAGVALSIALLLGFQQRTPASAQPDDD
jgi:hypothetical protein